MAFFCAGRCCMARHVSLQTADSFYKKEAFRTVSQEVSSSEAAADLTTADFSRPLSPQHAVELVLHNNPDLQMARHRIHQAEAAMARSDAAFYPVIGFFTEYSQGDAPSAYLFKKIDQRLLPSPVDFNDPGWFENFESGVRGRLNLYNSGRDRLNRQITRIGVGIARLDRCRIENELISFVIHAFYDVLAVEAFIRIAGESVSTVEAQLRIMNVRLRAGGALKSDILSLEVRLARAREDLLRSRNRYQTAWAAMAELIGISPDQNPALLTSEMDMTDIPGDYADGLTFALSHRPELHRIKDRIARSRLEKAAAGSGYLPRVDLVATYYTDDPHMHYNARRENWMMGIRFDWDLFTGFSTRADVQKASAQLDEMMVADRKTVLAVTLDVKTAYLNLDEADARFKVSRAGVEASEEALRLVSKQYEGGSAVITRYLEAELDRNRARVRAAAAYYDREKALSNIGRAIGFWVSRTVKGSNG